jgi:multicomponent Na+:H+ antiporter subunit C
MTAAVAVGILVAGGVFLICQQGLVRVAFGFVLLGHAANLVLISAGGLGRRAAPLTGDVDPAQAADPLVQAFVLTAIVITFGLTVYLLALVRAGDDISRRPEPVEPDSDPEPAAGDIDVSAQRGDAE